MGKLDGQVALISGSGRGIGRAVAEKFASEGASIVINDLDEGPALEAAEAVRALGGRAEVVVGSVTDPDFAERFVSTAVEKFGGVDIIVNNAGYTWDNVIQKMTDEQWQAIIDVHLTAPFRILRAAQPVISQAVKAARAEGREVPTRKVINISSVAGLDGNAGQVNYSAGKLGVVGMTKTLAKEWGRYNVTVNAVAFGVISTRLTVATDDAASITVQGNEIKVGIRADVLAAAEQGIPLGRAGSAQEAANGVYLLASPESSYITGQVLRVDGGL
ncbi:SDR family NAD(P)-dependent oxidoreductase [Microbacterium gorillae]|uniref:SDR family NAD(P)-dependent oxidoreductase n=1 Tax=Microbacterium gorillae TaxID=1231063 RepID=UPI00058FEEFE|nr:SDR family oxidoreductase [Microbacterium gorillae]